MTIDELIVAHWRDTVVLQGETPLGYTLRREQERLEAARLREYFYWLFLHQKGCSRGV